MGGAFENVAGLLPFVHAVELERAIISGSSDGVLVHLLVVLGYATVTTFSAVAAFLMQMKKQ